MKLYAFTLEETNGEQEYSYDFLVQAENEEDAWEQIDNYVSNFYYHDNMEKEKEEFGYANITLYPRVAYTAFYGGITLEVDFIKETTKEKWMEEMYKRALIGNWREGTRSYV